MLDVIIQVYLPMLQALVGYVTVEGLWGDTRVTPTRWSSPKRPPATKWTPGDRAGRTVWED
jgi:hypothetical protein